MSPAAANQTDLKSLRKLLFEKEDSSVYMILDGASVEGLLEKLHEAKEEWACLYRGELPLDLAEAAPYLVKLREKSELTDWILEEGWGKHWGIFAISQAGLEAMRRHFRKFLRVKDPDGKVLYFRYYDPRVLRVYLPTCNWREIKTIYGPVSSYLTEAPDGGQAIIFPVGSRRISPITKTLNGQ